MRPKEHRTRRVIILNLPNKEEWSQKRSTNRAGGAGAEVQNTVKVRSIKKRENALIRGTLREDTARVRSAKNLVNAECESDRKTKSD
jgi:hypothetical protein